MHKWDWPFLALKRNDFFLLATHCLFMGCEKWHFPLACRSRSSWILRSRTDNLLRPLASQARCDWMAFDRSIHEAIDIDLNYGQDQRKGS